MELPSSYCVLLQYVMLMLLSFNTFLAGCLTIESDVETKELGIPLCKPDVSHSKVNKLVFVSTMDGKVSALDLEDGGIEKWSIETGPGPMLSSSIHTLELANNGQWVRMIPSLSGGLYKMNGKSVEAVPISAEQLLKSSFRYSDDIVISGGIETRTYGVDSQTGKLIYECTMASCDNQTSPNGPPITTGDILIIQRQTQTVRAVEPRDGAERWNFSVSQHEVKLSADPDASCLDQKLSRCDDVVLKVIVPDGLICALDSSGTVIWKHKFEYPVVNAWRVSRAGDMKYLDLFGGTRTPEEKDYLPESPVLYVGMHNKQLYIQESVRLRNKVLQSADRLRHHLITDGNVPSIPWRPIPARNHVLGIDGSSDPILKITDEGAVDLHKTTALSILYASEYVNGQGFYLFAPFQDSLLIEDESKNKKRKVTGIPELPSDGSKNPEFTSDENGTYLVDMSPQNEENKDETPVQVIIVSFWYWWKEVMFTSIFTAIIVNLIIQRRFISVLYSGRLNEMSLGSSNKATSESSPSTLTSSLSNNSVTNLGTSASTLEFTSRYLTDFEPIRRLGRGGFGIVFQAKNKMDDCEYAVKRIPLPNKEEALERMKREVKALAKLDHQNIVRYFNSWVEEPPLGWQEAADNLWFRGRENVASCDVNIDLSAAVTPTSGSPSDEGPSFSVRKRNVFKSLWDKASSAIYRSKSDDKDLVLPRTSDDVSGSFIVFENSKAEYESSNDEKGGGEGEGEDSLQQDTQVTEVSKSLPHVSRRNRRPVSLNIGSSGSSCQLLRQRKFLYIQMQLCQRDSLKDWLVCNPVREKGKVLNIFDQIVSAVDYVHCQGLIHRDLKPSNIFFSYDGQIKVGDFGLVTTMSDEDGNTEQRSPPFQNQTLGHCHTAQVGTHLYMSPEQIASLQYDYKVDIFSLGVILFELLTTFSTEMERAKTLTAVRKLEFPEYFEQTHPEETDLLKMMLIKDPEFRLTTIGVRSRPPFSSSDPKTPLDWHFTLPHRTRLRPSTSE